MRLAGLTDLRRDPLPLIDACAEGPVTILRRNRPIAVLVHPSELERLYDRIEDLEDLLAIAEDDGERIPHAEVVAEGQQVQKDDVATISAHQRNARDLLPAQHDGTWMIRE